MTMENNTTSAGILEHDVIQSSFSLVFLLCCVRNRVIQVCCIAFPTVVFVVLYIILVVNDETQKRNSSDFNPHATRDLLLLLLMFVPTACYVGTWCSITCLLTRRQLDRDATHSVVAQKYIEGLQGRRQHQHHSQQQQLLDLENPVAKPNHVHHFNFSDEEGQQLLGMFVAAARANDRAKVQWCIDRGQAVDAVDALGRSALHWATYAGADGAVDLLLKTGATFDLCDQVDHLAPLHYATYYGHMKITRMLVDIGANLELESASQLTPLQTAELASLKTASVQPSHRMIIRYLRTAMGSSATPPLEHVAGLTVMRLLEQEMN